MIKKILFSLTSLILAISPVMAEDYSFKKITEADPENNYVFMFAIRSAAYLDWSNPNALTKTNINSIIAKKFQDPGVSTIGHAQIAWQCNDQGKVISGAAGQSGQVNGQGLNVVLGGWGLSVLDMVYPDGEFENEQEVIDRTKVADRFKNFAWIGFRVKKQDCLKLVDFVKTYEEKKAYVNYGFPVDPLKYEGAGCTSFANAALSFISTLPELTTGWVRNIHLPEKYIGKLTEDPYLAKPLVKAKNKEEEKKIPVTEFLFGAESWAKDGEPYQDFYYYDPELFFESAVHLENYYRQKAGMELKNPIRTNSYDTAQQYTKKTSEEWLKKVMSGGKRVRIEKIYSTTGLIIDL